MEKDIYYLVGQNIKKQRKNKRSNTITISKQNIF